ncbi:beta-1 3 exoglucanase precursor [Apiospora arundinis]
MGLSNFITASVLALGLLSPTLAAPTTSALESRQADSSYWVSSIKRQGTVPFGKADSKVFRNVKDYGAVGDGKTDDTAAINKAIQDGGDRCLTKCDSRTNAPAMVYFPAGTYMVSSPIIQSYYTQFVGDAVNLPTLKATSGFKGMAVIDADPYIEGLDSVNWYVNQNNFFRQIRNFVIDITALPPSTGAGIHWQVAQATSLQNIIFNSNPDKSPANQQKGIFMDNGSGGFMADLTFNGGGYGAFFGSQQFTTRNMTFNNCNTAIFLNWNWVWAMQDVKINNCNVGIDMASGSPENIQTGSLMLMDSKISGTPIGIKTLYRPDNKMTNNTLVLDNVDMSEGVQTAIQFAGDNSTVLEGNQKIASFAQGRDYSSGTGKAMQAAKSAIPIPNGLKKDGKVFTRTKPQYEGVPASSFVSVKAAGAKGDGQTDDTAAIQKVFDSAKEGQIIYFDHGAYLIQDTVKVPKNIKITGEMWPMIMAAGTKFNDESKPTAVFQVGEPGDVGTVEMSDLIFETKGPQAGAILVQWNLAGSEPGAAGLWDVHFRIGGTAGTDLQSDKCSKNPNATHPADTKCIGSFMMFHATQTASVYVENCWFWVADHELDLSDYNQIDIYNGRGVLIESQKPTWFWGTASEHSQMYNYQITNAQNLWMSSIQTETAYMQGNPDATTPFKVNQNFYDPDFSNCDGSSEVGCKRTWGVRVMNSTDIFVYGAGLYSFFENYGQDCLKTNSCQQNMVSIEKSSVHLYGLSTKASVNMLNVDGKAVALDKDNRNTFCGAIAKYESNGGPAGGAAPGGGSSSGGGSSQAPKPSQTATQPKPGSSSAPSAPIAPPRLRPREAVLVPEAALALALVVVQAPEAAQVPHHPATPCLLLPLSQPLELLKERSHLPRLPRRLPSPFPPAQQEAPAPEALDLDPVVLVREPQFLAHSTSQ